MPPATLTAAQARRLAVAAVGLAAPRPREPHLGHARRILDRLGVVQLDSVNVVARAHELALWSRLGPHPRDLCRRLMDSPHAVELWAHEASIAPPDVYRLLRWRMDRPHSWDGVARTARDHPGLLEDLLAEVAERGPVIASDLRSGPRLGPWWGWDHTKRGLECLFWHGRLGVRRLPNFTRVYDLPHRVLPPAALAEPPEATTAQGALLVRAAAALGVATAGDLIDHFRLPPREARALLPGLVARGDLREVTVRGWGETAYTVPQARVPRRVDGRALVSPFDPLVWCRPRTERLFGMRYRIEIYVPAHRRVHGYYVLPFLLGDALVARVDLKADRAAGVLRVRAAHAEPHVDHAEVGHALAGELRAMAGWLGLHGVDVEDRGDLVTALRAALRDG